MRYTNIPTDFLNVLQKYLVIMVNQFSHEAKTGKIANKYPLNV